MLDQDRIMKVNIETEMRKAYIDYSMSVIVSRALPDVRDGFKPVHRRILYGMRELGNTHDKPYKKCARIVGEVLGKYHPHGDSSVYGALVRMAQEWSMRYTLVDGQGNFGSVDGDSAAAMRYTEARLQLMGEAMMEDLEKETVDMTKNFDGTLDEPTVLPSKIPNLLVNGASGIAVGMATNIPTHNLGEVIDACVAYIDRPDIDVEGLMQDISRFDYSLTYHDTHKAKFAFAEDGEEAENAGQTPALVLYPGGKESSLANGYSLVEARFEYNEEDGKYYRFQYGGPQIDEKTGEQLAYDNVIFQYCHGEVRDENDYLAFGLHGDNGMKVQVFTGGKMTEGTWSRYSDNDPAYYTDSEGEPIELNQGKTWICLIWQDYADDVAFE